MTEQSKYHAIPSQPQPSPILRVEALKRRFRAKLTRQIGDTRLAIDAELSAESLSPGYRLSEQARFVYEMRRAVEALERELFILAAETDAIEQRERVKALGAATGA